MTTEMPSGPKGRHDRGRWGKRTSKEEDRGQFGIRWKAGRRHHEGFIADGDDGRTYLLAPRHQDQIIRGSADVRPAGREEAVSQDDLDQRKLSAKRPPPIFIVEQIGQRGAIHAWSKSGVEWWQLDRGGNLRFGLSPRVSFACRGVLPKGRIQHGRLGAIPPTQDRPYPVHASGGSGDDQRNYQRPGSMHPLLRVPSER